VSAATLITVLVALVLPFLAASGWWLGGRPDLAYVTTTGTGVRIVPRGALRLVSFRTRLVLDREWVRQVSVAACAELPPPGLRSPGLAVPGLRAGTYRRPEATSYWLVGRAPRVLRLDLAGGPVDYVLMQVRDPDGLATRIRASLSPAAGLAGTLPPAGEQ
jgi:hypothetical protein